MGLHTMTKATIAPRTPPHVTALLSRLIFRHLYYIDYAILYSVVSPKDTVKNQCTATLKQIRPSPSLHIFASTAHFRMPFYYVVSVTNYRFTVMTSQQWQLFSLSQSPPPEDTKTNIVSHYLRHLTPDE